MKKDATKAVQGIDQSKEDSKMYIHDFIEFLHELILYTEKA